jgi:hypothetical protein
MFWRDEVLMTFLGSLRVFQQLSLPCVVALLIHFYISDKCFLPDVLLNFQKCLFSI